MFSTKKIVKDISTFPKDLYELALIFFNDSGLVEFNANGEIGKLKNGISSLSRHEKIAAVVQFSVAVEYLLKAYLLDLGVNIFWKNNKDQTIDLSAMDGYLLIDIQAKSNKILQNMLIEKDISKAAECDSQSFSTLLKRIDEIQMDAKAKKILKQSLNNFAVRLRNRYVHFPLFIFQFCEKHFIDEYIPAINVLLRHFLKS